MTNYVQSTNFATKDALPSGDPLKIVKGTEINTEFANIAVAVATKADLLSPTFTGVPAAPTAAPGTSTPQLATTAFATAVATAATAAIQALHPVGSIYTSTSATNPGTSFGFGTWAAFGAGRVLVGDGGGFSAGATGGSADAIVVSHTHTGTTASAGTHSHTLANNYIMNAAGGTGISSGNGLQFGSSTNPAGDHAHSFTTDAAGSSGTNANLQPYVVVYMWTRTA